MRSRRSIVLLSLAVAAAVCAVDAAAEEESGSKRAGRFEHVYVIDFESDIEAMMWAYVQRRVERARAAGADCIVLRIDSPGGTVFHSEKISDLIYGLGDAIYTVAYTEHWALSGASMVAIACDEIIMGRGAVLGDSQPVLQGADGAPQPVGEKAETVVRAMFRKYAQGKYDPLLAAAIVSKDIAVLRVRSKTDGKVLFVSSDTFLAADGDAEFDGYPRSDLVQVGSPVVTKDQLLTMTADEAFELGFVKRRFPGTGFPENEQAVIDALAAPNAKVEFTEMSFSESASKTLLMIAGILSAVIALAVLFTLWQGPGTVTIIGGVAAVLVLLIHLTADQLNGFPLFLVILGVLLIVAEIFLFPGFGIAGVAGFVSMGAGFLFLATGSSFGNFDQTLSRDAVMDFVLQFIATIIAGFVVLFTLSRFFPKVGPARRMILAAPDGGATDIRVGDAVTTWVTVGAVGIATSPLRPAGSAEFDGRRVDVVSDGGFVDTGSEVRVLRVEGERVTVVPSDESKSA